MYFCFEFLLTLHYFHHVTFLSISQFVSLSHFNLHVFGQFISVLALFCKCQYFCCLITSLFVSMTSALPASKRQVMFFFFSCVSVTKIFCEPVNNV